MALLMGNDKKYDDEDAKFIIPIINDFNLLLVTATKLEKDTLHLYLKPINGRSTLIKIHDDKQTYFLGVLGIYNVVHVSCDHMGAISPQGSITTTMDAIAFCKPTVVVMVGIAFGKGGDQKIGDILVSNSVVPYEIQRIGEEKSIHRGIHAQACTTLLNRFKNITDWNYTISNRKPEIITGLLLSGEKLIDNPVYKAELLEKYPNAVGGEMEGYGVSTACNSKSITHWIIVKGICDFADGKKSKGKSKKQRIAAESSINLCEHLFTSRLAFNTMKLIPISIIAGPVAINEIGLLDMPTINDIEKEILIEMNEEVKSEGQNPTTTVQEIVRSFLQLDDVEKIVIAKKIGVFDDELNQMYADIRDKEIFIRTKEKKALSIMWEGIHSFSPFVNSVNPFEKVKIQNL